MKKLISFKIILLIAFGLLLTLQGCKKSVNGVDNPKNTLIKGQKNLSATKSGPISVCYIEVNNNSILDVGKYTLASNGANVFDIGIIFAANINYDTSADTAQLYFNTQVSAVLTNAATQIKPLQNQGIKVLLSILGNHEGAGICNFPTQAAAQKFAVLLSNAVTKYGLDGIDFDDEYADYGTNGTGQPNAYSFVYLVTALRQLMPNKTISFYDYGPAASELSYNGVTVGSKVNYSWNAVYGTWSVPSVPGLSNSQLGPAAIDISSTSQSTATSLAQETVSNGYGVYLTYNLSDADTHTYISGFTNALYGSNAVYNASGGSGGGGSTGFTGTHSIISVQSGLALDGGANTQGTNIQLYGSNNTSDQKWTVTASGSGYSIISAQSGLALDGGANTQGTYPWLYGSNSTVDQQWKITASGSGYSITSVQSGLALDGGPNTQGTNPWLYTANGTIDQQWTFQ
ncbi:endo-beta-N-acetylglucosaminidase H [Mucilaginibacter sp. X4EP1]|uniref:endo-beta-N-acetylglucosaminidase H n=1 Tax=Mucilaginibacter sp. X4EP1 TaxID=2723092 RepID=UPI002169EDB7|nr:endo-beta-N-acetylglucosaminidase H [Mucilaginibacter sp. X4EP1]MCS3812368.1 hypothetical protein [Mucilaginibacter sp. X4EP1]